MLNRWFMKKIKPVLEAILYLARSQDVSEIMLKSLVARLRLLEEETGHIWDTTSQTYIKDNHMRH